MLRKFQILKHGSTILAHSPNDKTQVLSGCMHPIIYNHMPIVFIEKACFDNVPLYFGLSIIYKGKTKEKFA
jgi:hypothetical protein